MSNLAKCRAPRASTSEYRREIDGLRAIAVLSVVGFHAFPNLFPGGFVGVDIFFVISGYQNTGIIFRGATRGDFSFIDFYTRRVRRIFPALLAMMSVCLLVGYQLLFMTEFSRMAGNIAAATSFVANFMFMREAGYFDGDSAFKPMLHLWSLSVEEQFYVVWPPLASFIALLTRRLATFAIVGLIAISFWSNIHLTETHASAAFFLPTTRAWELLLGALLAHMETMPDASPQSGLAARLEQLSQGKIMPDVVSTVGLGLVTTSALLLSHETFTGWRAVAPTIGAALIIAAGPLGWANRRLLSLRVAVFFGGISYPLYLWHWPILSFLRITQGDDLSRPVRVVAVLAAIGLAWLTYRFIERPVRFGPDARLKASGLAGAALAIGVGALVVSTHSPPRDAGDAYVAQYENLWPEYHYSRVNGLFESYREDCNYFDAVSYLPRDEVPAHCTIPVTPISVLVWGDSHAQHLLPGLMASLPASISLIQVTASGCNPRFIAEQNSASACYRARILARETIARVRPTVVVLAQRAGHLGTDWASLAASIKALGARSVVLVGPVPRWEQDLAKVLVRGYWPDLPEVLAKGLIEESVRADKELKRRYGKESGLTYVSVIDHLCTPAGCRTFAGPNHDEDLMTFDTGHLTASASRYVARQALEPVIRALIDPTGYDAAAH